MKILGVALNLHDHNSYNGKVHHQEERYSRIKHNLIIGDDPTIPKNFYRDNFFERKNTLISVTSTKNARKRFTDNRLPVWKPNSLWDYHLKDNVYYIDHHQSHAAYAFLLSKFKESDILAIDGGGDNFQCIFIRNNKILNLSDKLPIGLLWNFVSKELGFSTMGSGKVMGLVAYGEFRQKYYNLLEAIYDSIAGDFFSGEYVTSALITSDCNAEDIINDSADIACTLQQYTIDKVLKYILPLKSSDNLCIAGGVAFNGYLNEELTKHYNVFVPPAAGDEGQALGNYMHAEYMLNNNIHLPDVYAGQEYKVDEGIFYGLTYERKNINVITSEIATAIANGKIVGWYQGKSESGPRALGNRSILADPRRSDIKDIINKTIKKREDFRPFAPSVLVEHYKDYFDTKQDSPYMSRIVKVISDKIPGVTHADNTSRIQTVSRADNERFYDLIHVFYDITGVPMLLNTSFNCREPIVETPLDAVRTFLRTELDILVINNYVIRK